MAYETLIEPAEVARHRGGPGWVIIDCRFDLARTEVGRQAYTQAHIPGAHYAHLGEDLSSEPTATSGRHPLPDAQKLAGRLGQWGISNSTQVVAYDDANGAYAARLWWLLRWLGHRKAAVLNGGLRAWLAGGYPTDARPAAAEPAKF